MSKYNFSSLIIISFFALFIDQVVGMDKPIEHCEQQNYPFPNIQQINKGFYVGRQADKNLWLVMEKIDNNNYQTWVDYKYYVGSLTGNRGLLLALARNSTLPESKLRERYRDHYSDYLFNLAQQMCPNRKNLMTVFSCNGIPSGVHGFSIIDNYAERDTYVVYASKSPIQGRFAAKQPINREEFLHKNVSDQLKAFDEAYDDIIMCFGAVNKHSDNIQINETIEHRGIFRNPMSAAKDTFKGIAIIIHGFAGAVALKYIEGKKYMYVLPTFTMADILQEKIKEGDMFIDKKEEEVGYGDIVHRKFPPLQGREGYGWFIEGSGHFIKLHALRKIYEGTYKKIIR